MNVLILIPARYASTRFPGKPLAEIGGKPMIQHVVEKAQLVSQDDFVATDDRRIYDCDECGPGTLSDSYPAKEIRPHAAFPAGHRIHFRVAD